MRAGAVFAVLLVGAALGTAGAVAWAEVGDTASARRSPSSGLQDLAGRLNARERAIDRREAAFQAREGDLTAQEEKLSERLKELTALRADLDERLEELAAVEESRRVALVKMIEKMRPKEAAPFVGELKQALAVDVLDRMSPAKAGKVLAAMPPRPAARLAEKLTAPVKLP